MACAQKIGVPLYGQNGQFLSEILLTADNDTGVPDSGEQVAYNDIAYMTSIPEAIVSGLSWSDGVNQIKKQMKKAWDNAKWAFQVVGNTVNEAQKAVQRNF